jgi:hypothetical protein
MNRVVILRALIFTTTATPPGYACTTDRQYFLMRPTMCGGCGWRGKNNGRSHAWGRRTPHVYVLHDILQHNCRHCVPPGWPCLVCVLTLTLCNDRLLHCRLLNYNLVYHVNYYILEWVFAVPTRSMVINVSNVESGPVACGRTRPNELMIEDVHFTVLLLDFCYCYNSPRLL